MYKPLLKIYTYVDGVKDTPFPNAENPIEISDYTFTDKTMGSATLSASAMYPTCLDDLWVTGKQYVDFRGERYFITKTPSSSLTNEDVRFKHDIEFMPGRAILDNIYFYDVVGSGTTSDRYVSNSTKVLFYGDIKEFASRLNSSLIFSSVPYRVFVDNGISSEAKQVQLDNVFISNALQEIFNIFELPFYFDGTNIHIGYTKNAITQTFKYGRDYELLSVSKTNANYKITNRVTGTGGTENIQFYYPNEKNNRTEVEAGGGKWITPSQTLMPPIYRQSNGAERFYNAKNNTYNVPNSGDYYVFENEYTKSNPREQIVDFPDIYPTFKGASDSYGNPVDVLDGVAFDDDDNDNIDPETGDYYHPYFYVKLRQFSGNFGFNLFEQAIVGSDATIAMTSGNCAPCEFVIGVIDTVDENGHQVFRNPVQVDRYGNIVAGSYKDKVKNNNFIPEQQDTSLNSVWIAVRKDNSTFGIIMPNKDYGIKPNAGDSFVFLHINMPEQYILRAENKLEQAIIKYMANNNSEKFTFSIKLSRIFIEENPDIANLINSRARIDLEYNGKFHQLYISSYTYKSDSEILPEITVELADTLTINKNSLQTAIDSVKMDMMSSVGSIDFLKQGLKYFIRKDVPDTARAYITFMQGLKVGNYQSGANSGGIFTTGENGKTTLETDFLKVRMKAYFETLEIVNVTSIGGKMILTPGGAQKCIKVVDREDVLDEEGNKIGETIWDFYRCYFLAEQDGIKIENRFVVGDLAYSQNFNISPGTTSNVSNHYYWREVVGIGGDYLDLSKAIADTGSDIPKEGDVINQLGNRKDVSRMNALVFSSVDLYSPSITFYQGIDDFSYTDKDFISYGVEKTVSTDELGNQVVTNKAYCHIYGDAYIGARDMSEYMQFKDGKFKIKGQLEVGSTIGDGSTVEDALDKIKQDAIKESNKKLQEYANLVTQDLEEIQKQIDGVVESYFYDYDPTTKNVPASSWTTEELKQAHANDTFTNLSTGNSWKWVNNGDNWEWIVITDTATLKALALAGKAQDTADNKRRVFVNQPKDSDAYDVGDLWVNATYSTTYKNDILRCNTSKASGVLFDIAHWELASKYTDDTLAEDARKKALAAADAAADATTAASVVATSVDTLNKYVDGAFKDGIITDAEKQTIKAYLNSVNSTKKGIEATYTKLYANSYLTGTAKTGLKTAYESLVSAINDLIDKINKAIEVNATDADIAAVDTAFTTFNNTIGTFNTAVETANKAIQDQLKTFSDAAKAAADAAALDASNAKNAAETAAKSVTNLSEYVDGAFKDGIITTTESQAISTYINTVNNTKAAIKATYDKLYANAYLTGDAKTGLSNANDSVNTAIANLIKSIEDAIKDGVTTATEVTDVNAKFASFNIALGTFNTAVETANKAIQDKLKGYSDTAQTAADNAKSVADAAKARLEAWAADGTISPTEKQGIKDEIKRIDADKSQVTEGYTLYSLGTPTAFNEAHKAYRDQLVALSASTPENIAIPANFTANQTAYYTKRSEALAAIAQASKSVSDNAKAAADAAKARLDAWAADGTISPTEKQSIKDEIARIEADKSQVTAGYTLYGLGTPTAFNTAYTNYKDQLIKLSAPTPETITIPADFAAKQTTYYTERTAAINAINSASKKVVETVQANVEKALTEINNVKNEVAGLRDFTDNAFADGVLTATEYNTIKGYLKNIDTTQQDVNNSYIKVYENPLLDGIYKTDLSSAKSTFDTAINELRAAINALTPTISSSDRANFDAKYNNFNTKYGSFIAALNAANRYIQEKLNSRIDDTLDELTLFKPIKDALLEKTTTLGGLILSSTISLGYTNKTTGSYVTQSGITGIYDSTAPGGGIAAWYGGSPKDRAAYTDSNMPADVARGVIRMDGTGYFANGNFWWDNTGKIYSDPASFIINEQQLGDYIRAFQIRMTGNKVDFIIPQAPFQSVESSTYLQIGKARLQYDDKNKAFYVVMEDGTPAGFYATGFVSARGVSPSSTITPPLINSLGDIKDVTLTSLKEDDILIRRGSAWVNVPASTIGGGGGGSVDGIILNGTTYSPDSSTKLITLPNYPTSLPASDVYAWAKASVKPTYTWAEIGSKPSWIGSSKPSYSYSEITGTPSIEWDAILGRPAWVQSANKPSYAYSEIFGTPTSLKNPYALTLQRHGVSLGSYDGSAAKTFNIASPSWGEVTGKPSWIGSSKPSYAFSEITSKPTTLSGYGITDSYTASESNVRYVTTIGINGNYLSFTKNGGSTNLTIPFATKTYYLQGTNVNSVTSVPLDTCINYTINSYATTGIFPGVDNSNGLLTINTHSGNYFHQLGFSSNGNLYHRSFSNEALNTSKTWVTLLTSSNYSGTTDQRYYTKEQSNSNYVTSLRSSTDLVYYAKNGSEYPVNINVSKAPKWTNARTITLTGAVTGAVSMDGSANVSLNTTYSLGTLDSRYVNATGDTMTGDLVIGNIRIMAGGANNQTNSIFVGDDAYIGDCNIAGAFGVRSPSSTAHSGIAFTTTNSMTVSGVLRNESGRPTWNSQTIWHAGNDGSGSGLDADLLDGIHLRNSNGYIPYLVDFPSFTALGSDASDRHYMQEILKWAYQNRNYGEKTLLIGVGNPNSLSNMQIQLYGGSGVDATTKLPKHSSGINMKFGGYIYVFGTVDYDYYEERIAFQSDNVASATQLQTARTLWGQSFNGTGNVSGDMSSVGTILSTGNDTKRIGSASNQWQGIYAGWISGGVNRTLQLAANNNTKVWILTNGKVGIAISEPRYTLHVNGNLRVGDIISCGEFEDNQYGYINVTRPKDINACCYSFVSSGNFPYGIGYYADNGIWIGVPNTSRQLATSWLTINNSGIYSIGSVTANNGYLISNASGYRTQIGCQNGTYCHYTTTATYHWFDRGVHINGPLRRYNGSYDIGMVSEPWGGVYSNGWFWSIGNTGWYNETYKGGIYMTDTTYVRVYNNKLFYVSATNMVNFDSGSALSTAGGIFADRGITTNGYVYAKGAITARQTSDLRLKTDFDTTIDYRAKLMSLGKVVDFSYNELAIRRGKGAVDNMRHTSVIYQNALKANITGMCIEEDDGYGCVNPISPDLIFTIVGAVQANILSIQSIESRTDRIERELREAKEEIKRLRKLLPC